MRRPAADLVSSTRSRPSPSTRITFLRPRASWIPLHSQSIADQVVRTDAAPLQSATPPPDSRRLRVSVAEPRTMVTSANYEREVDNVVLPHLCFTSCPWRSSDGPGECLSSWMAQLGM
jgi:hypothetical protein